MFLSPWFFGFPLITELVSLGVLLIVVVTITRARSEPDPGGHRIAASFLAVVMGASIVAAVISSTAAVGQVASLITEDDGGWFEYSPIEEFELETEFEDAEDFGGEESYSEDVYSGALQAGLLAAAAVGVFVYHRRKLDVLLADPEVRDGAVGHIADGYRRVVSFFALAALAGGSAVAVHALVRVVAPGVFSTYEADEARRMAAETFFIAGWLSAAGASVLNLHGEPLLDDEEPLSDVGESPTEEAPIP